MRKFYLRRLMSLGVASALSVNLAACSMKEHNKQDDSTDEIMIEGNKSELNGPVYSSEMFDISEYDISKPVAVSIEEVVMKDGTIGYKIPNDYHPFVVDQNKPMPRLVKVLEKNDEYYIVSVSGGHVRNSDGIEQVLDYSGSVAVYTPYYLLISYKYNTVLNATSGLSCDLTPVQSDVFPEAYFLPDGYKLYSPNVENENFSIGYDTTNDGTIYGMRSADAAHYVGVRDEIYLRLLDIDKYEVAVRAVHFEQQINNTR